METMNLTTDAHRWTWMHTDTFPMQRSAEVFLLRPRRPNGSPSPGGEGRGEGERFLTYHFRHGRVSFCSPSPQPSPPRRGGASGRGWIIFMSRLQSPPLVRSVGESSDHTFSTTELSFDFHRFSSVVYHSPSLYFTDMP